jgi:predicted metal-dependent phosphoesterase TrpH
MAAASHVFRLLSKLLQIVEIPMADKKFSRCVFLFQILLVMAILVPHVTGAEPARDTELSWWKGNTHTHSLWSDGDQFPEMIADWYRNHGYHFLALSDHNVLSEGVRWMKHDEIVKRGVSDALEKYLRRFGDEWVETRGERGTPNYEVRLKPLEEFRKLVEEPGRFLMIQGEEISDRVGELPVHLNATNLKELIDPQGGRTVVEAIDNNLRAVEDQARRTGREILVHLNHPNYGFAITAEEMATVLRERFFEVYNGHPGVEHLGDKHHPSVERMWDIANTIRIGQLGAPPLFGLATDDSHSHHGLAGSRPGRGWIMVRAPKLEAETLIRAIKAGDFYASSGVTLRQVQFDPRTRVIRLEIDDSDGGQFTTEFIGTTVGYDSSSKERLDDNGKPLRATREYSADVGRVLATVEGITPSYQLTGNELYVRAVVTSNRPHRDPSFENQREQAWTQPVGWQEWLKRSTKPDSGGNE